MRNDKISRLAELKREELNTLRQDMQRLDALVRESQTELDSMLDDKDRFVQEVRRVEAGNNLLSATEMIERRNFLAHLHMQSQKAEQALLEVEMQRNYAQNSVKQTYMEMKSFEIIKERKVNAERTLANRRQFLIADDEQSIRYKAKE